MSPDILPGSYLIFHHLIHPYLLKKGSVIKVKHPSYGLIVKRIIKRDHQGYYWIEGINKESVSSLEIGAITLNMVLGIVVYTIKN